MTLEKKEIKYIAYATGFAFIVFGYIIPFLVKNGIEQNKSIYVQFLIFNVGIFVFLQIFLKSITLEQKINIKESVGLLLLFMSLDILAPPLMVSTQGALLTGPTLSGSAIDSVLGTFFIGLGLKGFMIYAMVYMVAPFIFLLISAMLLKNLVRRLG